MSGDVVASPVQSLLAVSPSWKASSASASSNDATSEAMTTLVCEITASRAARSVAPSGWSSMNAAVIFAQSSGVRVIAGAPEMWWSAGTSSSTRMPDNADPS